MSGAIAKAFEEARTRALSKATQRVREESVSHTIEARGPAPSSGISQAGEPCVGLDIWKFAVDGDRRNVGPPEAEWIKENFGFELQRNIDSQWVKALSALMVRGQFKQGTQLCFGVVDRSFFLVDGQHRLHAIIESGRPQEFQMCVELYADVESMRKAYAQTDRGRRRSTPSVLRANDVAGEHGVSRRMAAAAFNAATILGSDMRRLQSSNLDPYLKSDDGKLAVLEKWWPEVKLYEQAITPMSPRLGRALRISSVVAVALCNFQSHPKKAAEFWGGIAKDDGLKRGDPRKTLSDKLTSGKNAEFYDQFIMMCAHAWNAFMKGQYMSQILTKEGSPINIIGSPYKGQ